ncbi:MAG: protein kinase [Candidatus Obscuribacter sp.]|nr:protein kinase [Candidatus Obscuribacter sp.]
MQSQAVHWPKSKMVTATSAAWLPGREQRSGCGLTGASAAGLSRVTGKLTGRSTLTSRRATTGSTIASSRKMLGAGLVHIEPLLKSDPAKAVMKEARVPDHKRECSNCGTALTKRENGFCPSCSTQYDFRPKLAVGEMVADQYRVEGCIAFGGMGWIYLAMDVTLNRWVVLKGLLNSSDPTLAAAAVAERQFLAFFNDTETAEIYTFVQHKKCGYIVMEYVGGRTIKSIRKEKGPLPVTEAIAYIHRALPAFAYMHSEGMVYCDFKPDNLMLDGDDIKVIDLGGVRRLASTEGDVFGTQGFAARK